MTATQYAHVHSALEQLVVGGQNDQARSDGDSDSTRLKAAGFRLGGSRSFSSWTSASTYYPSYGTGESGLVTWSFPGAVLAVRVAHVTVIWRTFEFPATVRSLNLAAEIAQDPPAHRGQCWFTCRSPPAALWHHGNIITHVPSETVRSGVIFMGLKPTVKFRCPHDVLYRVETRLAGLAAR